MGLGQDLHISNEKRDQTVIFIQKQAKKLKLYKKMINKLYNTILIKLDTLLFFIKKLPQQSYLIFIQALSPQANISIPNRQSIIQTTYTSNKDSFTRCEKLIKALLDPLIIMNRKNSFIDQWLSKIQSKFEINWNYYPTDRSKIIYTENRVGGKDLQYLEPCL